MTIDIERDPLLNAIFEQFLFVNHTEMIRNAITNNHTDLKTEERSQQYRKYHKMSRKKNLMLLSFLYIGLVFKPSLKIQRQEIPKTRS